MDGPNPSQMDIKAFISSPTFNLQAHYMYDPLSEIIKIFPDQENEIKLQDACI